MGLHSFSASGSDALCVLLIHFIVFKELRSKKRKWQVNGDDCVACLYTNDK